MSARPYRRWFTCLIHSSDATESVHQRIKTANATNSFFYFIKKKNTKLRSFDVEVAFPSKQTLDIENCNRNSLLRTNSSSLVVCYCVVDMCHQHKVKFSRGREKNVSYLYTSYFSPCSFLSFEWPLLNKTAGGREFDDDGKNEQLSEKELLLRSAMGKWTHLLMLKSNGKEI